MSIQPLLLAANMGGIDSFPAIPLYVGRYEVVLKGVKESKFSLLHFSLEHGKEIHIEENAIGSVKLDERGKENNVSIFLRKLA